jgi:hypothetical protein
VFVYQSANTKWRHVKREIQNRNSVIETLSFSKTYLLTKSKQKKLFCDGDVTHRTLSRPAAAQAGNEGGAVASEDAVTCM